MTTQAFPANAVNLFLGTPADALTGSMTIRMKTARYYIEGTRLVKDTNYVVTLAWGKMAVEQGWATDVSGILPGQDTPAVSGTSGAPDTIIMTGLSPTASNTQRFANYVATANVGDTLIIPAGVWPGDLFINKQIRVLGAGLPRKVGSALVGGTVIIGEINIQDAFSVEVGFLGIDQRTLTPASYPNGITGGTVTLNDSTTVLNQYLHDIVILGRGFAASQNSQHGVLFQNGRGYTCERITIYNYLNNFVSRASGATFRDCVSYDAEANAGLVKSATAGGANDALDNTFINCRGIATADGFFANFASYAEAGATKVTRNTKFIACTADATGTTTGQAMFKAGGTVNAGSNRGSTFIGCCSKHADAANAGFLCEDDFNEGTVFVGCNAEDFTGLSFRSNATVASNLPSVIGGTCWRSGFPDIINVSGVWAVCEVNGKSFDNSQTRTVAQLPNAGVMNSGRYIVTDATVTTFASVVAGGGANTVPVYAAPDGTWRIG